MASNKDFITSLDAFLDALGRIPLDDVSRVNVFQAYRGALNGLLDKATKACHALQDRTAVFLQDTEVQNKLERLIASKMRQHGNPRDLFLRFDVRGDGKVTADELRYAINDLGIFLSEAEVAVLMERIDMAKDKKIDYPEFIEALARSSAGVSSVHCHLVF